MDGVQQLEELSEGRLDVAFIRRPIPFLRGIDAVTMLTELLMVVTLEDCIGLCGLTEEEVLAIAEHKHLPEIAATALAEYLLSQEHGSEKVLDMIVDDIRQAQLRGDRVHVVILLHVLHHFLKTHPEARPSHHPWSKRF